MVVSELVDLAYGHTLVIKITHEYKVIDHMVPSFNVPDCGKPKGGPVGPMVHGKLEP